MNGSPRWYSAIVVVLGWVASPSWGQCVQDANCNEGRVCERGRCLVAGEPMRGVSLLSPAQLLNERLATTTASAPAASASPPDAVAPAPEAATSERAARARFSVGRFAVEALGAGLAGSLAGYVTYVGLCGSSPCVGGALGGAVLNLTVVAGGTWIIGTLMGGEGDWLCTIIGALLPFSANVVGDPVEVFGIQMALAPLSAAAAYELTSQMKSVSLVASSRIRVGVVPFSDGQRQGWAALLGGTF